MKKLTWGKFAVHLFFVVFCVLCLVPFLLVVSISVSSEADILQYGYQMIPKTLDGTAYQFILSAPGQLLNSYGVTIFTTVVGTVLSVLVMAMLGYCISRRTNRWRRPITFYVFFTMLFSGGLVPTYILITRYLNLQDTVWVLILPGLVNAWHVILFSTFFKSIPEELIESAKMDGAGELRVLWQMVLPLSKPAIATIALFGVLARWNEWYACLLYIRSEELLTLQYLLQRIMMNLQMLQENAAMLQMNITELPGETVRMAMVVLTTLPMLLVFPFFQKYFVKGLVVGSLKG